MSADGAALLNTLAFTAARIAAAEAAAFTERLRNVLSQDQGGAGSPAQVAAERLRRHPSVLHGLLRDALQQSLLDAAAAAAAAATAATAATAAAAAAEEEDRARPDGDPSDLSPQSSGAMQLKLQVDNLGQALDLAHADQLAILGMRIKHLLCPEELRPVSNPFRAQSFLAGFAAAWKKFERDEATLPVVLQCLRPRIFLPLDTVYQALNQDLAERGILPDAEQQYLSDIPELTVAVQPSLQDRLQAWLAPEGRLGMAPARAGTLLLAVLEALSNDERLPFRVRKAIAQMAEPLGPRLREDSAFFFEDAHPARALLKAMFEAGLGGDGSDALSHAVAGIPARLLADPAGAAGELGRMADELRAALAARDQANARLLDPLVTEARRREAGSAAHKLAQADIAARLESGEVDAAIEGFLQRQWLQVLAFAHRVRDSKPELLPNVLQAMDELVWSLKPKNDAQERQRLLERLPHLLSLLNAWMNVIKWQGAEREEFFVRLAEAHAAALRAHTDARQELTQRMEAAQKGSDHQLSRRESEQQMEADAAFLPAVQALRPGDWVELVRNNGSRVNCRLGWVSPAGSRLVFIVPHTRQAFGLGAEELARALRMERAELISASAWMDQAFATALEQLGG